MFDNQNRKTLVARPRPACPGGAMFEESAKFKHRSARTSRAGALVCCSTILVVKHRSARTSQAGAAIIPHPIFG